MASFWVDVWEPITTKNLEAKGQRDMPLDVAIQKRDAILSNHTKNVLFQLGTLIVAFDRPFLKIIYKKRRYANKVDLNYQRKNISE